MAAVYPTSIKVFNPLTNEIDFYNASDVTDLDNEIIALQTYVGTNPHGDRGNLADRLNAALSGSGGMILTTGVLTETYPGKFWYRTDLDSMQVIKADNTAQIIGQSFSNTIFSYHAAAAISGSGTLMQVAGGSITPSYAAFKTFWIVPGDGAYHTCILENFRKIAGISSVQVYSRIWRQTANNVTLRVALGSVRGSVTGNGNTPQSVNMTLDVSGLANGTVFTAVIELSSASSQAGYMSYIKAFGL